MHSYLKLTSTIVKNLISNVDEFEIKFEFSPDEILMYEISTIEKLNVIFIAEYKIFCYKEKIVAAMNHLEIKK